MKNFRKELFNFIFLALFLTYPHISFASATSSPIVILEIYTLDDISVASTSETMTHVKNFIEQNISLKLNFYISSSSDPHNLTSWTCESDPLGCVALLFDNLSLDIQSQVNSITDITGLGLFYKLNGQTPLQAGSTYGPNLGASSGSGDIAYFSIPTDIWWYNNDPYQGFPTRASQIATHETINLIQSTVQDLYDCNINYQATTTYAYDWERDRLNLITQSCGNELVLAYSQIPTITNGTTSNISDTGATLAANIISNNGTTTTIRGFDYGTTTDYGEFVTEIGNFDIGEYTLPITGLSCNTTYNYSSFAANYAGTSYGDNSTFTTGPCIAPTITVQTATNITSSSVTFNGNITTDGTASSTVRGFNYGLNSTYGSVISETGTFGIGAFSNTITNGSFTNGATYHFQAFVTNAGGNATSSDLTFTIPNRIKKSGSSKGGNSIKTITLTPIKVDSSGPFSRNLTVGSQGPDVKNLQIWLNSNGYIIATKGIGSPGNESTYFGNLTKLAVQKFQLKFSDYVLKPAGLALPTGYVGAFTRDFLNKNFIINTTKENNTTSFIKNSTTTLPIVSQVQTNLITTPLTIKSFSNENIDQGKNFEINGAGFLKTSRVYLNNNGIDTKIESVEYVDSEKLIVTIPDKMNPGIYLVYIQNSISNDTRGNSPVYILVTDHKKNNVANKKIKNALESIKKINRQFFNKN